MINLENKKITIIGLARSGIAAAKFAIKQGALVTLIDKNENIERTADINNLIKLGAKLKTGKHKLSDFYETNLIILSPGVSNNIPAIKIIKKYGIPIIGEVEFASNFINKPIIGVTGTNGKTTTVKLIKEMLINSSKKIFLGGNTGVPLTECLYNLNNTEIIIVELSSFQLETINNFKPTTSILLNLAEDHMDRHLNFKNYVKAKLKIFKNQTSNNVAIFNAIDKTTNKLVRSLKLSFKKRPFSKLSVKNGAQIIGNSILIFKKNEIVHTFNLSKSKMKGHHNKENIAAAILAALNEGGNKNGIQLAIDNFEEITHRIEMVGCFHGINFINDSKATNIHAVLSALKCFKSPVILILGGKSKNSNFKLLASKLSKQVKAIIAFGEARQDIESSIFDKTSIKQITTTKTLEESFKKAIQLANKGDTVLFSPACSSFDQFKNYAERGIKFKNLVKNL